MVIVINIFIILDNVTIQQQSNFKWCIASVMAVGFLLLNLKDQNVGLDVSFNLIY